MICSICPRHCRAERTERAGNGFCAMPALPVLARAALHFGEEPCISGTRGSGTVFFSGCNLRCAFCQNAAISADGAGQAVTPGRLRDIFAALAGEGAHNLNLVTPTHFTEAILPALDPPPPLPVVWNSGGYDSAKALRRLEGRVQVFLPDFKYADRTLARRLSGAADYPDVAEAALVEMVRQTGPFALDGDGMLVRGVLVRHLMLPGMLQNTKRVIDRFAALFPPGTALFSLMRQYVPMGRAAAEPSLNRRVTGAEYRAAVDYLAACGVEGGYTQGAEAATDAYVPAFDLTGVSP